MIIACPWELPPPEVRALLPDCSFAAMEPQLDQPVFVLAANRWGLQKALELRMRRCPACRGALLLGGSRSVLQGLPFVEVLNVPGTWLLGPREPYPELAPLDETTWNQVRRSLRSLRPQDLPDAISVILHRVDSVRFWLATELSSGSRPTVNSRLERLPATLSDCLDDLADHLDLSGVLARHNATLSRFQSLRDGVVLACRAGDGGDANASLHELHTLLASWHS